MRRCPRRSPPRRRSSAASADVAPIRDRQLEIGERDDAVAQQRLSRAASRLPVHGDAEQKGSASL
jgi:hypothetical protein